MGKKICSGSITVEATLVLPLFLAIMGLFLFFFQVLFVQTRMESAIASVGRKCAVYWYGVETLQDYIKEETNVSAEQKSNHETLLSKIGTELVQDGITVLYVRNEVLKQYGHHDSYYTLIKNGKNGISFLGSGISESGTVLKIVVTYEIEIPFLPSTSFRCIQSCWKRLWTGEDVLSDSEQNHDSGQSDDSNQKEENYVYVTKNGQVYHTTVQCSYLKRTVQVVTSDELPHTKNESGQHYTSCELCCDGEGTQSTYYVTTTGERYHVTISCSSLVRYIEKRLFSEVGSLKGCTRCAQT